MSNVKVFENDEKSEIIPANREEMKNFSDELGH